MVNGICHPSTRFLMPLSTMLQFASSEPIPSYSTIEVNSANCVKETGGVFSLFLKLQKSEFLPMVCAEFYIILGMHYWALNNKVIEEKICIDFWSSILLRI